MAQRRFHYDFAFEQYLRHKAIPYVAVDEARRALDGSITAPSSLKSFDFVVYSGRGLNLLVDVKGRKHSGRSTRSLDNWVTQADVDGLEQWQNLFGTGFEAAFVFLYWCDRQPPDALFADLFESGDRWYAVLAVRLSDYKQHVRTRSARWGTVSIPAEAFTQLARPLNEMI